MLNMSHAVDGGVQPTVACRRLLAPRCCSAGRGGFRELQFIIAFSVSPVSVEV